jgi:ADP-ribose pyrophosphatase
MNAPPFSILKHETIFEGRVFTITRDEVQHVSGYHSVREVVEHHGGSVAVALFPNGDTILIRQFRYPLQREILELPAGKLFPGENPLLCAQRELEEETGWRAASMHKLSAMMTTPGFCSEVLHIYLATELSEGTRHLEQGEESIEVIRLPLSDAIRMCQSREIEDSKTITGLMLAGLHAGVLALPKSDKS